MLICTHVHIGRRGEEAKPSAKPRQPTALLARLLLPAQREARMYSSRTLPPASKALPSSLPTRAVQHTHRRFLQMIGIRQTLKKIKTSVLPVFIKEVCRKLLHKLVNPSSPPHPPPLYCVVAGQKKRETERSFPYILLFLLPSAPPPPPPPPLLPQGSG